MVNGSAYWRLMRFHRPVGLLLLLWPTLWALWLANHGMPPWQLLIIFIDGVIVTRAAGCILNDLADRNFDGFVERTKDRPLACGELTVQQAKKALWLLSGLALVLVVQLNALSFLLSLLAAALALSYPYLKRISHFPQVVLGLAFAMPIPMAFAASGKALSVHCWLLFAIGVIWPLMYDTAYAINDQIDDAKLGLKSTALWFGERSAVFIGVLQILLMGLWIWLGLLASFTSFFWFALGLNALGFIYQQILLQQAYAFKAFLTNQWLGGILWLGIALSLQTLTPVVAM